MSFITIVSLVIFLTAILLVFLRRRRPEKQNLRVEVRDLTAEEFKKKYIIPIAQLNKNAESIEKKINLNLKQDTNSDSTNIYIANVKNRIKESQQCSRSQRPLFPLCVSFEEKEIVKAAGAMWCPQKKSWYWDMEVDPTPVKPWLPLLYNSDYSPPYIAPDLVPESLWHINLRSLLRKQDWDRLRKSTYRKNNYLCTICGCKGKEWPVECDEKWLYQINYKTPRTGSVAFKGVWALCPSCHSVKHFGKANADGKKEEALAHMCVLNGWSYSEANIQTNAAFDLWEIRSKITDWNLDLTELKEYEVNIPPEKAFSVGLEEKSSQEL